MNVISVSQIVTLEIKICRCLREQTEQSDEPWLLSRLAGSKPRARQQKVFVKKITANPTDRSSIKLQ